MNKKILQFDFSDLPVAAIVPLDVSSDDSSEMNKHPTVNDIQFTSEQGSKREVLYAIDGSKGLTLEMNQSVVHKSIGCKPIRPISGDLFTFSEKFVLITIVASDYSTP